MRYENPITDRTAADVAARTAKAFVNVVDWARIYNNSMILNTLMNFLLGSSIPFTTITGASTGFIPTAADVNTLIDNIDNLRQMSSLPPIPGLVELRTDWVGGGLMDAPTYVDVNSWESVTGVIMSAIGAVVDYTVYCGVPAVGQPRFYQHRWRNYNWVTDSSSPFRHARSGLSTCGSGMTRNNGWRRYD